MPRYTFKIEHRDMRKERVSIDTCNEFDAVNKASKRYPNAKKITGPGWWGGRRK